MNCILLFDIDGTLVSRTSTGRSAGVRAMSQAALEMTGVDQLANQISFAGATDLDVARQLLQLGGIQTPTHAQKQQLLAHYVSHMRRYIDEDGYVALGDPIGVIPSLQAMGAVIGLGTGNVRAGAEHKLRSAGIDHLFHFEMGGYGDDSEIRSEILQAGVDRCRAHSAPGVASVIVIGDTPKDIAAAKAIHALSIGVPAGEHTKKSLLACGADTVVDTINDSLIKAVNQLLTAH